MLTLSLPSKILDKAPVGLLLADNKGYITAINHTGVKWLKYTSKELRGKKLADLLEPLSRKKLKKDSSVELEFIKKNGKRFHAMVFTSGKMILLVDTSEQKELKKELFILQQEKEYFTGIASHDLQHPLSVINVLCQLLSSRDQGAFSCEDAKIISLIKQAADEMNKLFQNYQLVSRYEYGKMAVHPVQTDITRLTHDIVSRYQEVARSKEIMILLEAERTHYLHTDPDHYSRILENLLSNAIKYSHKETKVAVKMYEDDKALYIEVKDEGIGIRKQDIPLLFRKFQTLSSKPTGGELSTGLGLHISKSLADQLNARIEVKSRWNKGSTFILSFEKLNKTN